MARYRLRLEPVLAMLGLRHDNVISQDKNARAIVTQYRESDLEFLAPVLAADGLSWRFGHDQDGAAPAPVAGFCSI